MDVRVVQYGGEWSEPVLAFQRQLGDRYAPRVYWEGDGDPWLGAEGRAGVARRLRVAVRGDEVVGTCATLVRPFRIGVDRHPVAALRGPWTLGPSGLAAAEALLDDALAGAPQLYAWDAPTAPWMSLLQGRRWTQRETAECVRIVRPGRFLRHYRGLRRTPLRAAATAALRRTGLGSLGLRSLHLAMSLRSPQLCEAEAEPVASFSFWSDELWSRCAERYGALAMRDTPGLNALLPRQGWPETTRLRIMRGRQLIGWGVVMDTRMQADPRFGDLRVGSLIDCLAAPDDTRDVVGAAFDYLRRRGVDLVVSHQAHPAWLEAFRDNGFLVRRGARVFCASPELQKALAPYDGPAPGLHLTPLDGLGPIDL